MDYQNMIEISYSKRLTGSINKSDIKKLLNNIIPFIAELEQKQEAEINEELKQGIWVVDIKINMRGLYYKLSNINQSEYFFYEAFSKKSDSKIKHLNKKGSPFLPVTDIRDQLRPQNYKRYLLNIYSDLSEYIQPLNQDKLQLLYNYGFRFFGVDKDKISFFVPDELYYNDRATVELDEVDMAVDELLNARKKYITLM